MGIFLRTESAREKPRHEPADRPPRTPDSAILRQALTTKKGQR
jgi:hypothetical protein